MKINIIVFAIYYFECQEIVCDAILEGSGKDTFRAGGEELNVLRENIKNIESDLHHVKGRLNFNQAYVTNEKIEGNEMTKRKGAVEESIHQDKGRMEDLVGNKEGAKPLRDGVRKVAKAACQCVCFVSKRFSNLAKTCYGKLRSLCCKDKLNDASTPVKTDASNYRETLDFGLY